MYSKISQITKLPESPKVHVIGESTLLVLNIKKKTLAGVYFSMLSEIQL